MRTLFVVGVVFALAGCVSHELGDLDDVVPVPVYFNADEVPCEYRLLRVVSVHLRSTQATAQFELLGGAGARAGADAVIADAVIEDPKSGDPPTGGRHPIDPNRPKMTGRRGQGGGTRLEQESSQPMIVYGQAIRCIEKH
jgi:hypothetical protein